MSEAPITQAEMVEMFGETMPWEAFELIGSAPDSMTLGQMRARLRQIAEERKTAPTLLERLRSEAVNWSASCGDLFGEAADEIERLVCALRRVEDEWDNGEYLTHALLADIRDALESHEASAAHNSNHRETS